MMYNVFRHSSKRLGARNYPQAGNTVQLDNVAQNNTQGYSSREWFRKQYELSDHTSTTLSMYLGNVRSVISDAKWSYNGIMTQLSSAIPIIIPLELQYRTEIDTRLGKERSGRVVKTNKITPYLLNLSDKDVKYGLEDAHSWLYDYTTAAKLLGLPISKDLTNEAIWNKAKTEKSNAKK